MELLLGQFSSSGCIKVYNFSPAMRGVGVGQLMSTCFVTTYYASLMALTIRYFLASFSDPLPWSQCKDEWNVSCIDSTLKSINFSANRPQSSAELYFLWVDLKAIRLILNDHSFHIQKGNSQRNGFDWQWNRNAKLAALHLFDRRVGLYQWNPHQRHQKLRKSFLLSRYFTVLGDVYSADSFIDPWRCN